MKALLATALLLTLAFPVESHEHRQYGPIPAEDPLKETYQGYSAALQNAGKVAMTPEQLLAFNRDYYKLIAARNYQSEMFTKAGGNPPPYFTLERLKAEPFYKPTISRLIRSTNPQHRMLAYMTVSSAGDSSFNDVIWKSIPTETETDAKFWQGTALLYLKDKHTSDLFDFLVANETFGDAHMLPLYFKLDKDALRETAYEKINSPNIKAQILAVQSLSVTGPCPKTEKVVKEAANKMQSRAKGHAIYTMKTLKMGNLKELLAPLLTEPALAGIAFSALLSSPTLEDQQFAESKTAGTGEVPSYILTGYLGMDDPENLKKLLILIRDRPVATSYRLRSFFNTGFKSDSVYSQLKDTIRKTKNRHVVPDLIMVMKHARDDDGTALLTQLASNPDPAIQKMARLMLGVR
ncbi:MAG: hypothetical protein WCT03_21035 [Candidatus Obscuribacterales bacterium]|jgi:hypothetical protein